MEGAKKSNKKRKTPAEKSDGKGHKAGNKKQKLEAFTDVEFKFLLKDDQTVVEGLEKFIQQASRYPVDTEYDIVAAYCRTSSDCQQVLELLESIASAQMESHSSKKQQQGKTDTSHSSQNISLLIQFFQLVLLRIADDLGQYKVPGASSVIRRLLGSSCLQCILGQLQAHNKVQNIKTTLRLLSTMTTVSDSTAREVMARFDLIQNSLLRLLHRSHDPEDVKTSVVQFIVSFLVCGDNVVVRQLLDVKGFINTLLTSLQLFRAETVVLLLTTLHDRAVCNSAISKTSKIRVFNEATLTSLCRLYLWNIAAATSSANNKTKKRHSAKHTAEHVQFIEINVSSLTLDQQSVRSVVHTLLSTLCTSFKHGIVFQPKTLTSSKHNVNHTVSNLLSNLRSPHLDPLVLDLVVNTLISCPDVINWYLPTIKHLCLPRPTVGCLAIFRFIRKIYESQPLISPVTAVKQYVTASDTAECLLSTLLPPKDIWSCFLAAVKGSVSARDAKTKKLPAAAESIDDNDVDDVVVGDVSANDSTAITHEAFLILSLVLKRSSATIKYVHTVLPWGATSNAVVRLLVDLLTKVFPPLPLLLSAAQKMCCKTESTKVDKKLPTTTVLPVVSVTDQLAAILSVMSGCQTVLPTTHRLRDVTDAQRLLDGVQWAVTCSEGADGTATGDGVMADERSHGTETGQDASSQLLLNTLRLLATADVQFTLLLRHDAVSNANNALTSLVNIAARVHPDLHRQSCTLLQQILSRSGLFVGNTDELAIWLKPLLSTSCKSQSVLRFFIACVTALQQTASDCTERVLEAVMQSRMDGRDDICVILDSHRLDEIMASDGVPLNTKQNDCQTEATSLQTVLPFSGLVISAVNTLSNYQTAAEIVEYLDNVLANIFYQQTSPFPLCYALSHVAVKVQLSRTDSLICAFMPTSSKQMEDKRKSQQTTDFTSDSMEHRLEQHFLGGNKLLIDECDSLLQNVAHLSMDNCVDTVRQVLLYLSAYFSRLSLQKFIKKQTIKIFGVYVDIILAAVERSLELKNLEIDSTECESKICDDVTSGIDRYRCLCDLIFSADCLLKLFVCHCENRSDVAAIGILISDNLSSAEISLLMKLSKLVSSSIATVVGRLETLLSADKARKIVKHYVDRLESVLSDIENRRRDLTPELIDTFSQFLSFLPNSVLERLISSLVQSTDDCVCELESSDVNNLILSSRGQLAVKAVDRLFISNNFKPIPKEDCQLLFRILERIPSDESFCKTVETGLRNVKVFSDVADANVTLALLKAGTQPSLAVASSLVSPSTICRKVVIAWILDGKKWKNESNLSHFAELVLCTLKTTETGNSSVREKLGRHVFKVFWRHLQDSLSANSSVNTDHLLVQQSTLFVYLAHNVAKPAELSESWRHLLEVVCTSSSLTTATVEAFTCLLSTVTGSRPEDSAPAVEFISAAAAAVAMGTNSELVTEQLISAMLSVAKNYSGEVQCLRDGLSLTWNQFIVASLRHHFTLVSMLQLIDCLISLLYPLNTEAGPLSSVTGADHHVMPLSVSALFEMVLSHSAFLSTIFSTDRVQLKDALVALLYDLVTRDVTCCQTRHLTVYFTAYHATLSTTDQRLLMLIRFYEDHGCDLSEYRPFLWGEKCLDHQTVRKTSEASLLKQPTMEEVLDLVDKTCLQQSIVNFPLNRSLQLKEVTSDVKQLKTEMIDCYDPAFILPLFTHLLAPECVVHCTDFAARHCLSYVLAALSSHADDTRRAAYHVLKLYYTHLEGAVGQHQYAVPWLLLYLLDCLRNSIVQPNARLPCIVTTFLARAAYLLTIPEDHMFLPICEFLLLKPNIDLANIPEFYKLFYSAQLEYKQERSWILGVIADGMREPVDYEICEKRFTLKILLGFYDSALSDQQTQSQVMRILQRMCNIKVVAWDLVKNRALLSWLTHITVSISETQTSSLVTLASTLWCTLLDGRDHDSSSAGHQVDAPDGINNRRSTPAVKRPPPCLPPLFTAEMILTLETLTKFAGNLCSDTMRDTLDSTLKSVKQHAQKTHKLYAERHYINPVPASLWQSDSDVLNVTT